MINFLDNDWVVSLLSILVGFAVTPLLQQTGNYIQGRRGPFTGTYIGFAGSTDVNHFDVELIKCRQVGNKISGKILGFASVDLGDAEVSIERSLPPTVYKFDGHVLGRQIQATYFVPERGSQNGGVIVLEPDANGLVFKGAWSGTGHSWPVYTTSIMRSRYVWFRDQDGVIEKLNEVEIPIDYIRQVADFPGLLTVELLTGKLKIRNSGLSRLLELCFDHSKSLAQKRLNAASRDAARCYPPERTPWIICALVRNEITLAPARPYSAFCARAVITFGICRPRA